MSPAQENSWWGVLMLAVMPPSSHPTGAEHQLCMAESCLQGWSLILRAGASSIELTTSSTGLSDSSRAGTFL